MNLSLMWTLFLFIAQVMQLVSTATQPPAATQKNIAPLIREPAPPTNIIRPLMVPLTVDQKRRAEQLTSVFENGTPVFDYRTIENLGDGRGYTAGKAGFTTATGDAYLVVKRYTEQVPTNPLALYLPRLAQLADEEDDDTSILLGFVDAWHRAALDTRFWDVQDAVIDELYYRPAMAVGDTLGLTSALGRAILYDTIIQHGGGNGEDSLSAIVTRTMKAMDGSPKIGVSEPLWLKTFLDLRRQDLLQPADKTTQAVWAISVGRVEILRKLLLENNLDLHGPIIINTEEYQARIP